MKEFGYVLFGIYALSTLWIFLNAAAQLHLLWHAKKKKKQIKSHQSEHLPFVSIQLPVYNEKYVVEGLLHSLSQLHYPKHLFEIQVLDDSTDETSAIIDRKARQLENEGFQVNVVRRGTRSGFKAGALQHGLSLCKGELVAIFDADFRPPQNFLTAMVSHFTNDKVGLVQARWGHLNREENFLTRIQTYLLDMHFLVEQQGRYNAGYFINFCGTAGIWRKQCIIETGGWDGSVLSEDLDLSYRAQLKGWTIVYDKNIEAPAEVPSVLEAFKIQQFRWTKGIAQIARKTLGSVWRMQLPLTKKLHSAFHLLGSFTFVCLFINAVLTLPMLQLRNMHPEFIALTKYTALGVLNLVMLAFLYYKSAAEATNDRLRFWAYYPLFSVVYLAMSVQNAVAVIQGFAGKQSDFVRTPKTSSQKAKQNSYIHRTVNWATKMELFFFLYFVYGIGLSIYYGDYFLFVYFFLMCWGLGILLYQSLSPLINKQTLNFRLRLTR